MMDDGEFRTKAEEKTHLTTIIKEWNASRLDMFALTFPDKDLEFHGVVRFYFQDDKNKVVTKCIRVSSKTTVAMLMDTLVEKFCPDLKMLTHSNYELFECHEKGDTRKLGKSERPLLVQLSWHRDDREGRFLLKSASAKVTSKFYDLGKNDTQFKRRLSKREKKELKKQRKQGILKESGDRSNVDTAIAQQLYDEKPESSLTRSISNPEAVMKRRREQKIQQRLAKYQAGDGQQRGGTLKIFAESLKPEIPYKTILASINQTSDTIVKDALEKFQLENEDPLEYCLVMRKIPAGENPGPGRESVVKDQDCPLAIQSSWPASRGFLTFHLRKRTTVSGHKRNTPKQKSAAELQADKRAAERLAHQSEKEADEKPEELPYLLEVLPEDMQDSYDARIFPIKHNQTIIGSSPAPLSDQYIPLYAPDIFPEHCVIESNDGMVTISPANPDARVIVNDTDIYETVPLEPGSFIIIANSFMFQYNESKINQQKGQGPDQNSRHLSPYGAKSHETSPMRDERSAYSPMAKEQMLEDLPGSRVDDLTVETTFDVNGDIASSPVRKTDPKGQFVGSPTLDKSMDGLYEPGDGTFQNDAEYINEMTLLPASLQFVDDAQDAFFAALISEVNGAAVHFKLAPAYSLYLACHYLISPDFRPELTQTDHGRVVSFTTKKMAIAIEKTVQENDSLAGSLAFWMANASELLHFVKQDTSLSLFTETAQGILAQSVQHAFRLLVLAMEEELGLAMPAFLDPSEDADIPENELDNILDDDVLERADSTDLLNWTIDERTFAVHDGRAVGGDQWITPSARIRHHGRPVMADVLYILSSAMSLLRRCRVNAALTIQLFSQLFHYLNMWLFNKLVLEPQLGLCTKAWGRRLKRRLGYVQAWAEKQGLELAADCHLCRIVQAAHLLDAPKVSAEDIASISSECFKLNSLQLKALLKMYRPDRGEHVIPQELIDNVVAVAEHTADELIRTDGREVRLGEDEELQLPFLLPEDGYSCDIIRGVPQGLQEFLQLLIETGICRFRVNPNSSGLWTVHQEYFDGDDTVDMDEYGQPREYYPYENDHEDQTDEREVVPETISVTLQKGNKGLGLSIVAAKGPESQQLGIYIKGVIEGGTAYQNGMLEPLDQIISVNGKSLVGVTQEGAAKLMGQSGPTVILEISKQAAVHHGLAHLLTQSSPATSPAPPKEPQDLYEKMHESTINENSPQIRTQRWIENHGSVDREEELEEEEELRRREEEEMYQEEENRRLAEEQRIADENRLKEEEEARRQEEIKRQMEEEEKRQEEEMKRIEENNRLMEEARKEREAQLKLQQEEDKRKFLEDQRLRQQRRAEAERRREEEREERERRLVEDKVRKEKQEEERRKLEEQRKLEEMRREEERIAMQKRLEEEEEQKKQIEEEKRQAEERRKFEQREREYEARLRFFEEQQRKREMEAARLEEEKIQEQERQKREEEARKQNEIRKEQERLEEARRIKEDLRRQEEQRQQEEQRRQEELRLQEEKRIADERKRIEEKRRHQEEELKRYQEEEERRIIEERNQAMMHDEMEQRRREDNLFRQREEDLIGDSRVYSGNYGNNYEDDLDDLPPPPEDLLIEENGNNGRFNGENLQERIQNQLVAERREHNEIVREQQQLRQTRVENYDYYAAENRPVEQRLQQANSGVMTHSFYSSDEDPHDIELEFQRRLQLENQRLNRQKKWAENSPDEIEFHILRKDREQRVEQERKVQLMVEDHARRSTTSERHHSSISDSTNSQRGSERGSSSEPSQRNSSTEDDWFAMQRRNHLEKRREQERIRREQLEYEEQERQRKLKDVQYQREQEQKMMEEYQRQKELRESNERYRQQPQYTPSDRRGNSEEIVRDEFRQKALADYDRRRETLDKEVERVEREKRIRSVNTKPPQVAKKPAYKVSVNDYDDDDEPPPPRPPPPSSLSPSSAGSVGRSPSSTSPQPARGDRFSFSQKTISNYSSYGNTRQGTTTPPGRIYSPKSQYQQPRSGSSSRSPSREDPATLDFKQKMIMFGAKSNDTRSTFSKKQREYMD